MKKRKTNMPICILLACSILLFSIPPSTAQTSKSVAIFSSGTIIPPKINLAPIPDAWSRANNGMYLSIGGVANNVLDTQVLFEGNPSVRQDPVGTTDNTAREVNGPYLYIQPGDHIVFSCWIKTSASSYGDTNLNSGGRIGIDYYGTSGRIGATQSPDGRPSWTPPGNWASNTYLNYVHWGTNTWTKITMDFVVPEQFYADPWCSSSYTQGQLVKPTAIIPWFQVWSSSYGASDNGSAWFANAELYINP